MKKLFTILTVLAPLAALAQVGKDTVSLREVTTIAERPGSTEIGKKQQIIDSAVLAIYQGKHLGELIAGESSVALKTYGPSGIVGAAMRGTSSDHTAVIWNCINIQSPTHGQFDFSLFPVFFTDKISVEPGAGTGAYGSGAIGGSVVMQNKIPAQGLHAKAFISKGSFENNQYGIGAGYSTKRLRSDTRYFFREGLNNYPIRKFYLGQFNNYYLLNEPTVQKHADFLQRGLMQQLSYEISPGEEFNALALYSYTDRLLPNSFGRQKDDDLRLASSYSRIRNSYELQATAGVQREILVYEDIPSNILSTTHSISGWLQLGGKFKRNSRESFYAYVNAQYITASVDGYGSSKPKQNRMSAWAGWTRNWFSTLTTDVSVRQQWIDKKSLPLIPAFGAGLGLLPDLKLKVHTSAVFHAPDFNDLYWAVGGNPNLLSESGWSHEAGLHYAKNEYSVEVTGFTNQIKNMIVWQPGPSFWSPSNLREVQAKGIELNAKGEHQIRRLKISGNLSFTHTQSITNRSNIATDLTLKKQLLYVPVDKGSARLSVSYSFATVSAHYQYTGLRFITTDNTNWLPAYGLLDLRISLHPRIFKQQTELFFACNNVMNEFFMSIPGYVMPGRFFETGITLNINK